MKDMSKSQEYYLILGLPRNAVQNDIRKAYRKAALHWQPDSNPTNRIEAAKMLKDLSEAYEVLSNKHLRLLYDKYGKQGIMETDVGIDFDGMVQPATGFPFRDAHDVFLEVFGGKDPTVSHTHNGVTSSFVHDDQCFEHSFPGFPRVRKGFVCDKDTKDQYSSRGITYFKASAFGGPTEEGLHRCVVKQTKILNGKKIVINKDIVDGVESSTIVEDGMLTSKIFKGERQPV